MMTFPLAMILALNWLTFCWHFLGVILVVLCLFLVAIILMQDSKGAGLTSAFGAGPGGESLLGARMQKDVARWTAITAGIFGVIVLIMGLMGTYIYKYGSAGAAGIKNVPAAETPESPGAGPGPIGIPPAVPSPSAPNKVAPPDGASPKVVPATPPSTPSPAPAVPPPSVPNKVLPPEGASPPPSGEKK